MPAYREWGFAASAPASRMPTSTAYLRVQRTLSLPTDKMKYPSGHRRGRGYTAFGLEPSRIPNIRTAKSSHIVANCRRVSKYALMSPTCCRTKCPLKEHATPVQALEAPAARACALALHLKCRKIFFADNPLRQLICLRSTPPSRAGNPDGRSGAHETSTHHALVGASAAGLEVSRRRAMGAVHAASPTPSWSKSRHAPRLRHVIVDHAPVTHPPGEQAQAAQSGFFLIRTGLHYLKRCDDDPPDNPNRIRPISAHVPCGKLREIN